MAGVALRAKTLEQSLAAVEAPQTDDAKELTNLISKGIAHARSLARGLDPVEVETSGLSAALQNLAAETNTFFDVSCFVRCPASLQVAPQPGLALYRIAQEAIHNAITHGEARRIDIELEMRSGQLCLKINDNGTGFDTKAGRRTGMGLRVMQYRARSIGGDLTINSTPKLGTQICCLLPRAASKKERPVSSPTPNQ